MPINEYVEDGLFQHRRVNDPELANRTRKEGDALRTRSVSLSSERLGITGKLDLLEEQGDAIRPVETKRSAAPKDEDGQPGFWENDAIQLCARRSWSRKAWASRSRRGMIYYVGSKARVEVPFDESLRARTLAAIALVRDLAARDVPPEPLPPELRHRCFGCSLAPVCLPEETLYLIHQPDEVHAAAAEPMPAVVAGHSAASRHPARTTTRPCSTCRSPARTSAGAASTWSSRSRARRSSGCRSSRSARWSFSATSRSRPRRFRPWSRPRCRWYS